MQLRELYTLLDVFNHLLLYRRATDRIKLSRDRYRIHFDISLYPYLFFTNTPFKGMVNSKCS